MNSAGVLGGDGASRQSSGWISIGRFNGDVARARKRSSVDDSVDALFTEKALAVFRELRQMAKDALDGEVLMLAEVVRR